MCLRPLTPWTLTNMLVASIGYLLGGLTGAAWAVVIAWLVGLGILGLYLLFLYLNGYLDD